MIVDHVPRAERSDRAKAYDTRVSICLITLLVVFLGAMIGGLLIGIAYENLYQAKCFVLKHKIDLTIKAQEHFEMDSKYKIAWEVSYFRSRKPIFLNNDDSPGTIIDPSHRLFNNKEEAKIALSHYKINATYSCLIDANDIDWKEDDLFVYQSKEYLNWSILDENSIMVIIGYVCFGIMGIFLIFCVFDLIMFNKEKIYEKIVNMKEKILKKREIVKRLILQQDRIKVIK